MPKKGMRFPSGKLEDVSCFSNKPSPNTQNNDFQNKGHQLIFLLKDFVNECIEQNPVVLQALAHLKETINPSGIIVKPLQDLNFEDKINHQILKPIGFLLKPEFKTEFYSIFLNNGLTGTPIEDFLPHFIGGTTKAKKIVWSRGNNLLIFTFVHLMAMGLIPYHDNLSQVLAEHFCNSKGKDFITQKLRKSRSKGVRRIENMDMIKSAFLTLVKKGDAK